LSTAEVKRSLNIPDLLGLADAGLDDVDVDADGNVYVSDGVNGMVYKFPPNIIAVESFSVIRPGTVDEEESSLNISVAPDSTFCLADSGNERVIGYSASGEYMNEFPAPGGLSLCRGPEGMVYVLSNAGGVEHIDCYDQLGGLITALPAPARHREYIDSGLVNLDSDSDGNVYISYGMPPYRIWKVSADGSGMDAWGREIDFPEDAILIADLAVDREAGVVWVLLACKEAGRQLLDAFSLAGEFLGTVEIPHSQALYSIGCSSGGTELYLLDAFTGPGTGNLVRLAMAI
jgi:streptogramin lyase